MRFMREVQSARDPDVMVPEFKLNKEEAKLILGACADLYEKLPKKFIFTTERARLRNITRVLRNYLEL